MLTEFKIKKRGIFDSTSPIPFKVSRSGIDSFINCPRCFILNNVHGIRPPGSAPYTLNCLVDKLLKKEFDQHRAAGTPHPLMIQNGIDAVPFQHPMMDEWRENFKGVTHLHESTNLLIRGAVDDLWINYAGEIHIVDYKATSSALKEPTLDDDWKIQYKRQMEVYQWLMRRQGLKVSDTSYFVYANGRHLERFNQIMQFKMSVLPYVGDDSWVEPKIMELKAALLEPKLPLPSKDCEHCGYVQAMQTPQTLRHQKGQIEFSKRIELEHGLLTLKALYARGWTASSVRDFLGIPDRFGENPHGKDQSPMRLYDLARVIQMEAAMPSLGEQVVVFNL